MIGKTFQIQNLHAAIGQTMQQCGFGGSGIAPKLHKSKRQRLTVQHVNHQGPVRLVAAFNDLGSPADL